MNDYLITYIKQNIFNNIEEEVLQYFLNMKSCKMLM